MQSLSYVDFKREYSQFTEKDLLGQGTYGSVYKIIQNKTGRPFALKRILSDEGDDLTQTIDEIIIASKLTTNFIVKIFHYYIKLSKD